MTKTKILVTGGTGYIGSHTVVTLLQSGYDVVIIDNLSNSDTDVLDGIAQISGTKPVFFEGDICKKDDVIRVFAEHRDIEAIIHFAALKAVGESVEFPLKYYYNNVGGLISLLDESVNKNVKAFVFSSSCTVYGQPDRLPVDETAAIRPESPYGNTKWVNEEILKHTVASGIGMKALSLRYFNPIGAHPSALIGELPLGVPNNLLPFITQTACGVRDKLTVFGNNYNTPDGTCIRDYIDVNDLAEAHVKALEYLLKPESEPYDVVNLGTGKGVSVLEIVSAFEKSTGVTLNYTIGNRRPGDVEQVWADTSKAEAMLHWKATRSLKDTVLSAWNWEKHYRSKSAT